MYWYERATLVVGNCKGGQSDGQGYMQRASNSRRAPFWGRNQARFHAGRVPCVRACVHRRMWRCTSRIKEFGVWVVFPAPDAGALFMLALSALWFGASASVRELISERTIWRREARVGLSTTAYLASKVTVLGAIVGFQCLTLSGMNYFMMGMYEDPYLFSLPLLATVTTLTGFVGMALGLLMSAVFSSSEAAVGTLPLVLIPVILVLRGRASDLTNTIWLILALYVLAKILEHFDEYIFATGGMLSGHTLKHFAASMAPLVLISALWKRRGSPDHEHEVL